MRGKSAACGIFGVAKRPEVVVLRIMSLVEGVDSISIKDERVSKH
jgi:hypothetical protein